MDKNITVATMQFKEDVKVSTEEYLKTYYTFNMGDIAFEGHQSKEFRFGRFVENDIGDGIVSHIFAVFRPVVDYDLKFWKYAINNENIMQGVLSRSTKASTMMHDLVTDDFLSQNFWVPDIKEQKRIGSFLANLDHLITLHQRKLEKLKMVKKSMLENCFPKNGEKSPRIRFGGFMDDWEQRKLYEMVGMTYGGGTPSTANDTFWYGDIPWIQSSNVVEDELFNVDIKKHISRDGLNHSAAQLVPENSVAVVTHVGVGKLVFMPYSYTTSQDFISLGDMKCEPRFLCYALYKRLQEDLHIVQGSAIKGITKEDLMNKVISVPQITEQTKIANTLQGLDNLITLHQCKLNLTNNYRNRSNLYGPF